MITYTEADNGRTVDHTPGDVFEVVLVEGVGSAYHWRLIACDPAAIAVEATGSPPPVGVIGGQRNVTWQCKVRAPGRTTLEWAYQRGWEPAPARTFALVVLVSA